MAFTHAGAKHRYRSFLLWAGFVTPRTERLPQRLGDAENRSLTRMNADEKG